MADNNEDDVRGVIKGAIEGIYSALGFDATPGNVYDYLLEEELPEKVVAYLSTLVSTKNRMRAWAVQCYSREDYTAAHEKATRQYEIVVEGYYGAYGSTPINTLIDHARQVRGAIYGLNLKLAGTVDRVSHVGALSVKRLNIADVPDELFIGRIVYEAEKYSPTWT